jgi:uncharacterized cupredoxin-like copper-binding protein
VARRWIPFVCLTLFSLVLAACSGGAGAASKPADTGTGPQDVSIRGLDTLKYEPTTLTVRSGRPVHLTLNNPGALIHDWVIDNLDGNKVAVEAAPSKTATLDFTPSKAGSYEFYCSQPGHKEAGMKGTLVVQ